LKTRRGDNADVVKLSLVEATAKKVGLKAPKAEKTEKKEVKVAKKPAAKKTVKKAE